MRVISTVCIFLLYPATALPGVPLDDIQFEWSGHLRGNGSIEDYNQDHLLSLEKQGQHFLNGGLDTRLNGTLYYGDRVNFHMAYEAVLNGGETRQAVTGISDSYQGTGKLLDARSPVPSDDQQFFSLTRVIADEDSYIFYHRIDRLMLSYSGSGGDFSIGRQPLTWGNGLLFNPADLVNPFSPSDIIRDYKIGSDMILYQNGFAIVQDLQAVAVPRRNEDGDLSSEVSTVGGKSRITLGHSDLDVYLLKNYQDPVIGGGGTTYLGDGVLRGDLTWTLLDDDADRDFFFSSVINYDYSWIWLDKNWYGFIEFYYNGLGSSNVYETQENTALMERIARGDIFVTGRYYVGGMCQFEAHPLVNLLVTLIYNLEDHSFLLQPRVTTDLVPDIELLIGASLPVGSDDTEFGELTDPDSGLTVGSPLQIYALITWYF